MEQLSYLIIDDERDLAERIVSALEKRGEIASSYESSSEAFSLHSGEPDRIILDLRLKGEFGLDVLRELRSRFPDTEIVLLTGYGSMETAVKAMRLGAKNVVSKPASIDEILAAFEDEVAENSPEYPTLEELEWEHIQRVLVENNWNISRTAKELGLHRRSLQRKLAAREN